jgi:hypothetical protein
MKRRKISDHPCARSRAVMAMSVLTLVDGALIAVIVYVRARPGVIG